MKEVLYGQSPKNKKISEIVEEIREKFYGKSNVNPEEAARRGEKRKRKLRNTMALKSASARET